MPTKCTGKQLLNPKGRKAWREDGPTRGQDLQKMHGVWEWDTAKNAGAVLREKYFVSNPATGQGTLFIYSALLCLSLGRTALTMLQVNWHPDFYYPFLKRWTERVRGAVANGRGHEKPFFAEPIPNEV